LELKEAFDDHEVFLLTYKSKNTESLAGAYLVPNMGENVFNFLFGCVKVFKITLAKRPDVVFSTGAEIAVPVSYFGKLFGARVIYVECSAQVVNPSVTGRIVYPIADLFLVQWKNLLKKYGSKAQYVGGLI
jgi:UDP-N-acetylglucosamine:LPS N-acetylglucosamine transferase